MTDAEKVAEWVRCYELQQLGLAKLEFMSFLRQKMREGDKLAGEAFRKVMADWMREK